MHPDSPLCCYGRTTRAERPGPGIEPRTSWLWRQSIKPSATTVSDYITERVEIWRTLLIIGPSILQILKCLSASGPKYLWATHVVPTSWLNYLRRQIVFCLYVFSFYFCLFFIYSLSFLLFVFVPLNLSKLSLIVSLSPLHFFANCYTLIPFPSIFWQFF